MKNAPSFQMRRFSSLSVFAYSITQHLIWGISLLLSPDKLHTTSIDAMYKFLPEHKLLGMFLLIVSLGAIYELFFKGFRFMKLPTFLYIQQFLLVVSAFGALTTILSGHFADGVIRSRLFLLADQCPHLIIAALHTLGILTFVKDDLTS